MTAPVLSLITVCFNAATTLRTCIDSVAAGKDIDVEYILIDGASTDATAVIARQCAAVIDVLVCEADEGIFDAMNKGLARASGKYVGFINADDAFLPGAMHLLLERLRNDDAPVEVLYGDWIGVDARGVAHNRRADHRLRGRYALCHQAVVASRLLFPRPRGFDLRYRLCADFDLLLRWQGEGRRFERLPKPLVRFSEVGASATFLQRSAFESIGIALRRARLPWSVLFSARLLLYVTRATLVSCFRRGLRGAPGAGQ